MSGAGVAVQARMLADRALSTNPRIGAGAARLNPFDAVKAKLAAGLSSGILVFGDSTTRTSVPADGTPRRHAAQWMDSLVAAGQVPATHGARIFAYDSAQGKYVLAETLRDPGNGLWLDMHLASHTGSVPRFFLGVNFFRAIVAPQVDAVVLGHGINLASYTLIDCEYVAAVEQLRAAKPHVSILATTQHPLQANTSGETSWRPALLSVATELGIAVDDTVYQQYLAAGKPNGLYNGDGIHQSTGTGCALYVAMLNSWWNAAQPIAPRPRTSRLALPGGQGQLVRNGDFSTWTNTAAVPDLWTTTGSGTIAFSRDTTNYADPRRPFSARMVPSGSGQTGILQTIATGTLASAYLAGRPLTAAARLRKDQGNSRFNLGRLSIWYNSTSGGSQTLTTTGGGATSVDQGDGFQWHVARIAKLPDDLTQVQIVIYVDSNSSPDGVRGINLDQVSVVPGLQPLIYS